MVSDFLDLLGWRHDRTGPKGKPFASSFDVLGMNLDLSGLRNANSVTLKNKEGRVENFFFPKVLNVKENFCFCDGSFPCSGCCTTRHSQMDVFWGPAFQKIN